MTLPGSPKWWTLGALCFSLFMTMLDGTALNVALPSIQDELGMEFSGLQWVINVYALTWAVLMLSGGKLADHFGRRFVFLAGLGVFTAASTVCALAATGAVLIAGRGIQGVGAALMMPATLAIITTVFPREERGLALGIWAGVSATALALGPLVGGVLTDGAGWEWIFWTNLPIGAAGLLIGRLAIPETRDTARGQRLDLPGLVLSAAALLALTYGLIEGQDFGWGSPATIGLVAGGAAGLGAFVVLEARTRAPMLDLSLFRSSSYSGAVSVAFLTSLAVFGILFFLSLYMQDVLGYSAVETGAGFLPWTATYVLMAPVAGRLSDRLGSRWLIAAGMALIAVALLLLAGLDAGEGFGRIALALLVGGVGMAFTMSPTRAAALGALPPAKAGIGSGVLQTFSQVGGSFAVAVLGAVLAAREADALAAGATAPEAFVEGMRTVYLVSAGAALVAALVAALTIRREPA
jgi:EmrB/QacA subfamily drug resistance transporter